MKRVWLGMLLVSLPLAVFAQSGSILRESVPPYPPPAVGRAAAGRWGHRRTAAAAGSGNAAGRYDRRASAGHGPQSVAGSQLCSGARGKQADAAARPAAAGRMGANGDCDVAGAGQGQRPWRHAGGEGRRHRTFRFAGHRRARLFRSLGGSAQSMPRPFWSSAISGRMRLRSPAGWFVPRLICRCWPTRSTMFVSPDARRDA